MKLQVLMAVACLFAGGGVPALASPTDGPQVDVVARLPAHPSIVIQGDAAFKGALSGVRGGAGTPTDPYVISNWTILHSGAAGIRLEGTTAHVVIENVYVAGHPGRGTYVADCVVSPASYCDLAAGVLLLGASNVTIRHVRVVDAEGYGVFVKESSRVTVRDSRLGWAGSPASPSLGHGATVFKSLDVQLSNLTIEGAFFPVVLDRSKDVLVEDTRWDGHGLPTGVTNVDGVTFARNRIANSTLYVQGTVSNLSIVANEFPSGDRAVATRADGSAELRSLFVCGNLFQGFSGIAAVELRYATDATLVGNRFVGNWQAFDIQKAARVVIERNHVTGSTHRIGMVALADAGVHNNSFVGNSNGIWITDPQSSATYNWWGDPRGPAGHDGSTGDALHTSGAEVPFLPALPEAPDLDVDCASEGPFGGQTGPFTVSPSSEFSVEASVDERVGPAHARLEASQGARLAVAPVEAPV